MTEPPPQIVALAVRNARESPCAKSQRGAVAFGISLPGCPMEIMSEGFNGPPAPFGCSGTDTCRAACRYICAHAEARALREAVDYIGKKGTHHEVHLVHVKTVNGELVAGGGPSCVPCSKEILDSGLIDRVWLYRLPNVAEANAAGITRGDDPRHAAMAAWHSYTALEFHELSLVANGLPTFREEPPEYSEGWHGFP